MTRLLSFALPLALCSGCFLIASTDEFTEDQSCDLELDVRNFSPHIGQTFEVRLVQERPRSAEDQRPQLLALAIFDPLQHPNMDLQFPNAVPALTDPDRPRPTLDFYADFDMDGAYTDPPSDHTWRVEDPCAPDRDPTFEHNLNFIPLPDRLIGGGSDVFVDFCPNLATGDRIGPLGPLDGTEPIEVRVTGTFPPVAEGMPEMVRPVGFYRLESVGRSPMGIHIPAVFDSGFFYRIEVIVDRNDNFAFDDEDQGWVYSFNPADAPTCAPVSDARVCGISPDTVNEAPACRDGADIRVRLSRAHIANFGSPADTGWVEVPEGT